MACQDGVEGKKSFETKVLNKRKQHIDLIKRVLIYVSTTSIECNHQRPYRFDPNSSLPPTQYDTRA